MGWRTRFVDQYALTLGGVIETIDDIGSELVHRTSRLLTFEARRGVAGSSGTTTIELAINGTRTGDTLTWTSSDSDLALKSTIISQDINEGDTITFDVTSAEVDAEDIFAKVST